MNDQLQLLLKVGALSGLIAGLATGVVARVSMRLFALALGEPPSFSIGGTLFILLIFGVVLGVPLGLIYLRFWRPFLVAGAWNGLAFGVLLFVLLIALPFMLIPSDEATLSMRLMAIATFIPVPLVYGVAVGQLAERALRTGLQFT